jgi:CRISPR-associated endonuclease/helicase Cas3
VGAHDDSRAPTRSATEAYLHGVSTWEPPETHVAWREEVWEFRPQFKTEEDRARNEWAERKRVAKFAAELLNDYPLKPHELLRDRSDRVFRHLVAIAARNPDAYAWLVDDEGRVEVFTLKELADKDKKERIDGRTVLLPEQVGGLRDGLLDGGAQETSGLDVSDKWYADEARTLHRRRRVWGDDEEFTEKSRGMRLIRRIDLSSGDNEDTEGRSWYWFELSLGGDSEGSKNSNKPVTWVTHTKDVVGHTERIVQALPLGDLRELFVLAAKYHDLGKQRKLFQTVLGNTRYPNRVLAKSGKKGGRIEERYRHEFGSLLDAEAHDGFKKLSADERELVLHLIAAHHGRGRPHFPTDEAFDPEPQGRDADAVARGVPRRFARLQRKYGRWGLAYLESLLRAADYAASACPSEFESEDGK